MTKKLGAQYSVSLCSALRRDRHTAPQYGLRTAERAHNVRNAFVCSRPAEVQGRHCVLVDDIVTTGSTPKEAGRVLFEAGALSVWAVVIARSDSQQR
ncbi:hypothetical protein COV04_00140 [Candidatus Uhrbacteria bacterium CG10_big_fil_rev_8_21_14_0_10_48_11]|uniref:Phosphoribosyltransferase domain-containing protein n=1 Tax=Candidatus Uhrbacteria bacterium CG10_big_fil_rev_8_21_14_0_10_48_11 TaxID=1975037 RepID=A0A2M8LFS1_9BACT|nr:MAG: hypothetical protein COV04_00140 [Candidatus Uhrbacteria bacterium CG10_big_fil_rev_8_21_14_0_10_48_11]